MSLRSDHKALMFIGAIAVLGAGVRVVRAANSGGRSSVQPALARQQAAADSAARAGRAPKKTAPKPRAKRSTHLAGDSTPASRGSPRAPAELGPLDRRGYVAGRLDLDVATAAQIDSLPGVGPAIAKRIVLDRIARGPFVTRDGLRRVPGVGPAFIARIDSLITLSGTVVQPVIGDTLTPRTNRPRRRPPPSS